MKKTIKYLSYVLLLGLVLNGCDPVFNSSVSSESSQVVEDYYTIDVSSIMNEMLVDTSTLLEPTFKNLGDVATPNYSTKVIFNEVDVTNSVYNQATKTFTPTSVGSYDITFTVLDSTGNVLETLSGKTFAKKVTIDSVIQSFAPINSAGSDVIITEDEVTGAAITFGTTYTQTNTIVDSGQYKVTGLSFKGSYSITYKLSNVVFNPEYNDPAFYFGWTRDDVDGHDDCLKVSSGNGTVATWIWGQDGLADLSKNEDHGWSYAVWYNAPGSMSAFSPISGEHFVTFQRYVNAETSTAVYGIKYDNKAFTYLDIGTNYTDQLRNVWLESVNTSATISVESYTSISDNEVPTISLTYADCTTLDTINLLDGIKVVDNSGYGDVLARHITVEDPDSEVVELTNYSFVPAKVGTYTISVEVADLYGNETVQETTINVTEPALTLPIINLDETSSTARTASGIILYYSATLNSEPYEIASVKVGKGGDSYENSIDVTDTVLSTYQSTTVSTLSYPVFKANEVGEYWLAVTAGDSVKTKKITVTNECSNIYGLQFFETGFENVIVGKNTIIYDNIAANVGTGKLGFNHTLKTDWTLSFDVTDLKYSAQGKFGATMGISNSSAGWGGWEDITIGGNVNDDLWGYETSTIGSGWLTYQWRSNWQDVTDEFKPNPLDNTVGCARGAADYKQYAIGTHSYKIQCTTDLDGNVTYTYYIDNQIEVVHHLPDAHDTFNSNDFIQFWANSMSGIVNNISIS